MGSPILTEQECANLMDMLRYNTLIGAMTNAQLVDEAMKQSAHLPLGSPLNDCLAEMFTRLDPTWTTRKLEA